MALALLISVASVPGATITINANGAGFSDSTAVSPVGGNTGTTRGQQRLIVLQKAAEIWGNTVASTIPIVIDAQFSNSLFCDANSATLGSAGPTGVGSAESGVPLPNTWYTVAEFNMLTGMDHRVGAEISMTFNAKLDDDENCLTNTNWYYGLDHNEGNDIDLLATALHEIAHGLGFLNFFDENTGQFLNNQPDVYSVFTLDPTVGERWDQMNPAERVTSAKNCGNVVWAGQQVMSAAPSLLDLGTPRLLINSPAGIADDYQVGPAFFSTAPLSSPGVTAPVQLVNDGSATITDGCQSLLGFTPGNMALMDRNSAVCTTATQINNAAAAGASAALIVDSSAGCPPPSISGSGTTIPAAQISQATGNLIKGQLPSPGVNATLGVDAARRQGADPFGFVQLYATDPVQGGSSISHFDTSASPSLLMEPAITPGLTSSLDLTPHLLADIGWTILNTADLSITKTGNVDPVVAGSPLTYTINVTNNGPNDANNVVVTDTLPAEVAFASTSGCNNDPNGAPGCSLGTIVSGLTKQFTVNVNVDSAASGSILNAAAVSSSTVESSPGNETASEATSVTPLAVGAVLSSSGFESGGVAPWIEFGGITAKSTASAARTGLFGLELSGGSGFSGVYRDVAGLTPGQNYVVSAWVRRPAGTGMAFLWLHDTSGANASVLLPSSGTANYSEVRLDYRANGTGAVRIHLVYNGQPGMVEWDDVALRNTLESGFETASLAPWLTFGGSSASATGSAARSGSFGVQISGGGGFAGVFRDVIGLTPGQNYAVTAWVRRPSGSGTGYLWLHDTTGANASPLLPAPGSPDFRRLTLYYRANATGALRIHLVYNGQPGAVDWDDIAVRQENAVELGFESGGLPPWQAFGGASAQARGSAARSGSFGLELSGGGGFAGAFHDVAGLTPGQNYAVTAWVRRPSGGGTGYLWLHDTTGANASPLLAAPGSPDFRHLTLYYRANATGAVRIHLVYNGQPGAVEWDDIAVRPENTVELGFESGGLPPWQPFGGASAQVSGSAARSGSFGLELSGGGGFAGAFHDVAGLTPGQNYAVTAWVRRPSGGGTGYLWLHDTTGANASLLLPSPGSSDFRRLTLYYRANATGAVRIHLVYNGLPGAIEWDEVSLWAQQTSTYDFESGALPPWQIFGGSTAQVTTAGAHSGSFGLELSGGGGFAGVFHDVPGLTPGQVYEVSTWVRRGAGSGQALVWVHDTTGANVAQVFAPMSTVFQKVSLNYTANATGIVRIHLVYDGQPGLASWDDVSVSYP